MSWWERRRWSSSRPMSSKCDMSVRTGSGFEFREDECNEEDLEDLEPVRSGGEPGAVGAKVVISSFFLLLET